MPNDHDTKPLSQNFLDSILGDGNAIADDSFESEQRNGGDGPADHQLAEAQGVPPQQPQPETQRQQPPFQPRPAEQPAGQEQTPSPQQAGISDAERQELQQLREDRIRLEERAALIRGIQADRQHEQQRLDAEKKAQDDETRRAQERPDPLIDPQGAIIFDLNERLNQQQTMLESVTHQLNTRDQQRGEQDIQTWMNNDMKFARIRNAGFDQAVDHLRAIEVEELNAVGIRDPQQIEERLMAKLNWYANVAAQNGVSIADAMYQRAVRLGFQPGQATPATMPDQSQPSIPAPQPQRPSSSSQKLDQVRKGQSLSGMGRTPAAPPTSQEAWNLRDFLLTASDEDVARLASGPDGQEFMRQFEALEIGTLQ